MKKFFGIGLLALLTTAYFTSSCSRDEFSGSMIEAKKEAFNEVFIETYGTPNPQHDWGFGTGISSRAFTRSENANANEWADPNKAYGGLKVPPPLTPAQIAVVKKYFQTHPNLGYEDPQWTHYFIQQVYKGHTDVPAGCATPEAYMAANGTTYLIASDYMDHLAAIDGSFVDHINNFNHGDCSENDHVLDNGGNANDGPFHTDKIMYMHNSTTKHFGYFNSNGSLCHTNYTGLVSYTTIMQEMGSEADCLNDGWNRSFMGFDFEQMVDDQCYATENNAVKNLTIWGNYIINGSMQTNYVYQYNSQPVKMLSDQMNRYCGDKRTVTDAELYTDVYDANNNNAYVGKQLNTGVIDGLLDDGYLPVDNKSLREWVKVGGCADGYFSDWIVTLTKAERNDGGGDDPSGNFDTFDVQEITDGRIFCEDLGSAEATDIDYNDVVFDAFTYVTKTYKVPYTLDSNNKKVYDMTNISSKLQSTTYNKTDINLLAAGGTITIKVAGQDVNQLLGIDKTIMANTYVEGVSPNNSGYSNFNNGVSPVKFTVNNPSYVDLINIPIVVKMGTEVTELQAIRGSVPQKFLAPVGTPWPAERVEFNSGFEGFQTWVNNRYATPWYTYVPDKLYNLKFAWSSIRTVGGRITDAPTGNDAITVEGKGNNSGEEKFITVSLESTLAVGDQIAITGYRNRDDNAIGSLYLKFGDYIIKDEQVYNNKKYGSEPNTFVWTVTSEMANCSSFQISRNLTGTNVYITDITIIGGFGAQDVDNNGGGNSNGNGGNNNGNTNGGGSGDDAAPSFGTLTGTEVAVNTTTLSSNSNLTVSASDISNTPAATVYVYGTGDGSVSVNGVEATTVNTRAATGVVKSCTLTPAQMGLNGLSITGSNFTVYRLSYQATTLPSVSQPAGTLLFGGNGQSKNMATWGDNQLKVAGSNLSGLTKNSKIRVAGIGFGQGNVEIDVESPWQVIQSKTYTTNSAVGEVSVEFELTTEQQAKDLLAGGLVVQGNNFILKYVTVENPSSTGGGGTTINIWSGSNDGENNWFIIYTDNGGKFDNAKEGDILRVTAHPIRNNDWWQFNIANGNYEEVNGYIKNDTNGQTLSTLGYQEITLTQTGINYLKKGGLMSYKTNLVFTAVDLIQK